MREMAAHTGLSKSTVQRLWAAHGIAPHRVRGFKLSNDLEFEEKYWDVVGLYLNPPQNAVVLCCDEKSQCQALERTQTGLPLGQGHIRTRTHDYYRHGTVTLFAALDYLSGKVLAHTANRHRHSEWLAFLKKIDASVAADKEIHIICDNYATHKHPRVKAWLARKKRFHLHFTPTSASWLNLVERFFGEITRKVIRLGSFQNVPQLVADIFRFLEHHNLKPTRYQWTADPQTVLDKINRAWQALLEEMYSPIYGTSHSSGPSSPSAEYAQTLLSSPAAPRRTTGAISGVIANSSFSRMARHSRALQADRYRHRMGLLRPFLTMVVLTVVFGKIAALPSNGIPYPILVVAATLPWQFFSNSLAEASNSLAGNAHVISKSISRVSFFQPAL